MQFQLNKDIVFFDIESTGLNIVKDRIVQIALIKYSPDHAEPEELEMMINPGGVLISEEAMAVHGITAQDVANKPTFTEVADILYRFIGNADLAGYNSDRFDIPMLIEEFNRAGIEFDLEKRNCVDVQKIFYKMEPRTLQAALRYYCDEKLEDAHDALADVRATVKVLQGQLKRYDGEDYVDGDGFVTKAPIKNDMAALSEFTTDTRTLDSTMRLKYDAHGEVIFNFGKYKGMRAKEVFTKDRGYSKWILEKDFSVQVKNIVRKVMKEMS